MKCLNPSAKPLPHVTAYPRETSDRVRVLHLDGHRIAYDPDGMAVHELGPAENPPRASALRPQSLPGHQARPSALCLVMTDGCQLACDYCYVRHEVRPTGKPCMDEMTVVRALDLLGRPEGKMLVTFFGGEPLLAWRQIRFAVDRAERLARLAQKPVRFHATTNGLLLDDDKLAFLEQHGFSLLVSIDGPPELHDAHRRRRGGGGTYDAVREVLDRVRARPALARSTTLRGTFLRGEAHIAERLEHLNQLCDEGCASGVAVEPAEMAEMNCASGLERASPREIVHESLAGARWAVGRAREGRRARWRFLEVTLGRLLPRRPGFTECGAGWGYVAVEPDGTVHACHKRCAAVGHVRWGLDEDARAPWREKRYLGRARCPTCWARNVCGGGCKAASIKEVGDIRAPTASNCARARGRTMAGLLVMAELTRGQLGRVGGGLGPCG